MSRHRIAASTMARPASLGCASTPPPLRWAEVPARLVHKTRSESVLLREWSGTAPNFLVTASWTSEHPYFGFGRRPSMVVAETLRQAVILVAHAGFDVPQDAAFVMQGLSVNVSRGTWRPGSRPVEVSISCRDVVLRDGTLRSMVADVIFEDGGGQVAAGHAELVVLPASSYARVRGGRGPRAHVSSLRRTSASMAGCDAADDVLLSVDRDGSLWVAINTGHTYLFDHPADHVPGMTILEAARQAALHQVGWDSIGGFDARFVRYAELSDDIQILVSRRGDTAAVAFSQAGHPIAEVTFRDSAGAR